MKRWTPIILILILIAIPATALAVRGLAGANAGSETTDAVKPAKKIRSDKKPAARKNKPSFTVLGVYTTVRFDRGEFAGLMPVVGDDFFARERLSFRKTLTSFFAYTFKYERMYTVTDPADFEEKSDTIYRDVYYVHDPTAGPNRFNLDNVKKYAGEIGVRYVMLGDVTKLDIKVDEKRDVTDLAADATFYIYDSATSAITFQQTFSSKVRGYAFRPDTFNADFSDGDELYNEFSSNDLGRLFVNIGDQLVEAVKKWRDDGEPLPAPPAPAVAPKK